MPYVVSTARCLVLPGKGKLQPDLVVASSQLRDVNCVEFCLLTRIDGCWNSARLHKSGEPLRRTSHAHHVLPQSSLDSATGCGHEIIRRFTASVTRNFVAILLHLLCFICDSSSRRMRIPDVHTVTFVENANPSDPVIHFKPSTSPQTR